VLLLSCAPQASSVRHAKAVTKAEPMRLSRAILIHSERADRPESSTIRAVSLAGTWRVSENFAALSCKEFGSATTTFAPGVIRALAPLEHATPCYCRSAVAFAQFEGPAARSVVVRKTTNLQFTDSNPGPAHPQAFAVLILLSDTFLVCVPSTAKCDFALSLGSQGRAVLIRGIRRFRRFRLVGVCSANAFDHASDVIGSSFITFQNARPSSSFAGEV